MPRLAKLFRSKWLWRVPLAALVLYGFTLVSFSSEPKGAMSSYAIFHHHWADVIEFKKGVVTHHTCCGDSSWGTYARRPDGGWIWTLVNHDRHTLTTDGRQLPWWQTEPGSHVVTEVKSYEVEIRPGLLKVELLCPSEPRYNASLRRRVFWRWPL